MENADAENAGPAFPAPPLADVDLPVYMFPSVASASINVNGDLVTDTINGEAKGDAEPHLFSV